MLYYRVGKKKKYLLYRMNHNPALRNFIQLQQQLSMVPSKPGRKKKPHGTAHGGHPFGDDDEMTFAKICAEKPEKKVVIDYFKDKVDKLIEESMKCE